MESLRFRPKPWMFLPAFVVGLGLTAIGALFGGKGHDSVLWTFGHDAFQALGGLVLGLTALSAALELVIRKRWKHELQINEVDLFDEVLHLAGAVSQDAAYVLFDQAEELTKPFQLPWTFVADSDFESAKAKAQLESNQRVAQIPDDDRTIWDRLERRRRDLRDNGSRLRDSTTQLDESVSEPKLVLPLLKTVATLNRKIRILDDTAPSPGAVLPSTPQQTAVAASGVLIASVDVAKSIREPFQRVRPKLDQDLQDELNAIAEQLASDERVKEWLRRGDELNKNLQTLTGELERFGHRMGRMAAKAESPPPATSAAQSATDEHGSASPGLSVSKEQQSEFLEGHKPPSE